MANHPIVHIEIASGDRKEASKFYNTVFDWKMDIDPNFDYYQFRPTPGPGGAFVKPEDNKDYGPVLLYIGTDDIEGTLARIEEAGGKTVVPRTEIPNTGWFSIFTDPTGNHAALFTPVQDM